MEINTWKLLREYRDLMMIRQRGRCHYCGVPMAIGKDNGHWIQATIDHVWPKIRGCIETDVFNLVLACAWCNTAKGRRGADWMALRIIRPAVNFSIEAPR